MPFLFTWTPHCILKIEIAFHSHTLSAKTVIYLFKHVMYNRKRKRASLFFYNKELYKEKRESIRGKSNGMEGLFVSWD